MSGGHILTEAGDSLLTEASAFIVTEDFAPQEDITEAANATEVVTSRLAGNVALVETASATDTLTSSVTPAAGAQSGVRRLAQANRTKRQPWMRQRFCAEVETAYRQIWLSIDTKGLETAPATIRRALNEAIIQMIARLPQIAEALADGYKIADIRAAVAAIEMPANVVPTPAPMLLEIEERHQAVTVEAQDTERDARKAQGVYDKARAEQDRLATLVETAQAGLKAAHADSVSQAKKAKVERLRREKEAHDKSVRAALEDLGQRRIQAEAAKLEAKRVIANRIETRRYLREVEMVYRRAMANLARRKLAAARAAVEQERRALAEAEETLDLITGNDDEDVAVILLGG